MKTYVVTTGAVFALLVVAHIWRAIVEGSMLMQDPFFIIATVISTALAFWAWRVFRLLSHIPGAQPPSPRNS